MDLKEQYRKETKATIIIEDGYGHSSYSERYVEWLEDIVKNLQQAPVMQRSGLLSCPNCCSGDVYKAVNEDKYRCMECRHEWAT